MTVFVGTALVPLTVYIGTAVVVVVCLSFVPAEPVPTASNPSSVPAVPPFVPVGPLPTASDPSSVPVVPPSVPPGTLLGDKSIEAESCFVPKKRQAPSHFSSISLPNLARICKAGRER